MKFFKTYKNPGKVLVLTSLLAASFNLHAAIQGVESSVIDLYAKQTQINTPDGDSLRIWAFSNGAGGVAQYPAPSIIVNEGDTVSVTVHNVDIPQSVSLVFPGQGIVTKTCSLGLLTVGANGCSTVSEAENVVASDGGTNSITYTFKASKPGTYLYQSGVSPQIQIDMGLVGAMIVRPLTASTSPATTNLAYNDERTAYEQEYLFFLSEMDPKLHYLAEHGGLDQWDNADYQSVLFFINGRNAPDTLAADSVVANLNDAGILKHQPYGSLVTMFPGERILLRVLNAGRNQHPLHLHGNHFNQVARDGNLLLTTTRDGNIGIEDYTLNSIPGFTADLIYSWTGKDMGWDIYNSNSDHGTCTPGVDDAFNNLTSVATPDGFHDVTWEYCADHNKPLPVVLPENQDLGFGGFYGGSPYLGDSSSLPIGEGGLNPAGGMVYMWHSHSERELTNNDIYPGGMLTMMIVNRRK